MSEGGGLNSPFQLCQMEKYCILGKMPFYEFFVHIDRYEHLIHNTNVFGAGFWLNWLESFGFKIIHCDEFQTEGTDKIAERITVPGGDLVRVFQQISEGQTYSGQSISEKRIEHFSPRRNRKINYPHSLEEWASRSYEISESVESKIITAEEASKLFDRHSNYSCQFFEV